MKALIMLLISVLIIGQADNLIRSALVSGRSRLSFQLSMLSVLGGVAAFGMLGIVLGPVVVAVMTAMLDVYLNNRESSCQ
jgi:predicted PurR-regulated permease PerM